MATIVGGNGGTTHNGNDAENDSIWGAGGGDILRGGPAGGTGGGNDFLDGGTGSDLIYGGAGDDTLIGGEGNTTDTIYGGAGTDTADYSRFLVGLTSAGVGTFVDNTAAVNVNLATTSVTGGLGSDRIFEVENVIGGGGADTITGNDGANLLDGRAGADGIYGGLGSDTLVGGAGVDTLFGGNDGDLVYGGTDGDLIYGDTGADTLFGEAGVDTLFGGADSDLVYGGDDADLLYGDSGNDTLSGDAAADTVYGGSGEDSLSGGGGVDQIFGGFGNDIIDSGTEADTVFGGAGNDTVDGGTGADLIYGGPDPATSGLQFNWSDYSDEQNLAAGVVQDVGGINVTVSYSGGFTGATFSAETTGSTGGGEREFPIYVGAGEPFNPNSSAEFFRPADGGGTTSSTVQFDFAATAGSDFQSSVQNLTFRISDVDLSGFTDSVTVQAFDINGVEVPVTIALGSTTNLSQSGNTVTATGGAFFPNQVEGSILYQIAGPVARVVVSYTDLNNAAQAIRLSDLHFDALPNLDNDSLLGGDGNDTIFGGVGLDTILGNIGDDRIYGGVGSDSIDGGDGNDLLFGGEGNDSLAGGDGVDVLQGEDGNDTLSGDAGTDGLFGGAGNDLLYGGADNDILQGGADNDTIFGELGDDEILGGDGNDSIDAGAGNDLVYGDAGDDTINFGSGNDTVYGGDGNDLIDDLPNVQLAGLNLIYGGAGNDTVFSGDDADTVFGDAGNDSLAGEAGNDLLYGGADNDTLFGGTGNDTLTGGTGTDFIFAGADRDLIDMSFNATANDALGSEFVDGGSGAGTSSDNDTLRVDITGFGWARIELVYDPANSENGTITFFAGDGITQIGVLSFSEIENLIIVCFTAGTRIMTERGAVAVEDLAAGDLVMTRDNGAQPLRWVGTRVLTAAELQARPELQPVRIGAGALGAAGPDRSLMVSPQHRVLIEGARAEMYFGETEVLVPAKHLVGMSEVTRALPVEGVTYVHILFDRHEIVQSDGIWTESFQPAERTLSALDEAARAEVLALFPELAADASAYPAARLSLRAHEAKVLISG